MNSNTRYLRTPWGQLIRSNDPNATELPKGVNRAVARYMHGKYPVPFVGLKQQRKLEGLKA